MLTTAVHCAADPHHTVHLLSLLGLVTVPTHLSLKAIHSIALHKFVVCVEPRYHQASLVHRTQRLLGNYCCYAQLFLEAPGSCLMERFTCRSRVARQHPTLVK